MKKILLLIVFFMAFVVENVFAKDLFFSVNKYEEEEFSYVLNSYDSDNETDGIITLGTVLKEKIEKDEETYNDYQVLLMKYNNNGKKIWSFDYGKTIDDKIYGISYTYDENNNVNGYLIVMNSSYNIEDTSVLKPMFVRVDLDGILVDETLLNLDGDITINKILETSDGYLLVGSKSIDNKIIGISIKVDRSLNVIYSKEYNDDNYKKIEVKDIISNNTNGETNSYVQVVLYEDNDLNITYKLVNVDRDSNVIKTIKDDFDIIDSPKLGNSYNGFILYGYTDEVKLQNNNNSISYYLIKYSIDCEMDWELIGENPIDNTKDIKLYSLEKNNANEYLLMYTNGNDSSEEVIKITNDGIFNEKIKKINNIYYDYYDFLMYNEVLYLVGKINCPEEDDCGYATNSLLLVSSKDKVIEVTEKDSGNVLVVFFIIALVIVAIVFLREKKSNNVNA